MGTFICGFGKYVIPVSEKIFSFISFSARETASNSSEHVFFMPKESLWLEFKHLCRDSVTSYGNTFLKRIKTVAELENIFEGYTHISSPGL